LPTNLKMMKQLDFLEFMTDMEEKQHLSIVRMLSIKNSPSYWKVFLTSKMKKKMKDLFQTCYRIVDDQIKETIPTAGACVVTSVIKKLGNRRLLYTANLGDSRAILSRDGVALRLSEDHKPSTCLEDVERLGTLNPPGFIKDDRVNGMIAVTRAIGDHNIKRVGYVRNDIYFTMKELEASDDFLILACDGVWDVLEDQDAVNLVRNSTQEDLNIRSKQLINSAKKGGSTDNLTAVIIRL